MMQPIISSRLSHCMTTGSCFTQRTYLGTLAHRCQAIAGSSRSFTSCKFPTDLPMKRMVRFDHASTGPKPIEQDPKQARILPWIAVLGVATVATTLAWQFNKEETKLDRTGRNFFESGQYTEALECCQKALKIREKELTPDHPDLAGSFNDVGICLITLRKDSEALECFQKALKIQEKILSPDHLDLANTYYNVGELLDFLGRYAEGLEYAQKALKIREKVLHPNHRLLAQSYSSMANHARHLGQFKEAGEYTLKALMIVESAFFFKDLNLAKLHSNIGANLFDLSRYSEALKQHQKALEIVASRKNHPSHTAYLQKFIVCIHFQPEGSLWESSKEKILTLYIPILGENHPLIMALQQAAPKWPLYLI